ncbi:MAG TPA: hypothetical protein VMW69_09015 [Spirochaetia bacterium]|nr:hypothetical protein [Spirochaetia bacterium]
MARVVVDAGVCGFRTTIRTSSDDGQTVTVRVESDCPNLARLVEVPLEVDAYSECLVGFGESPLFTMLQNHCKHPGCPVYSGIIKGIEVSAGLALPKDASITVSPEDD